MQMEDIDGLLAKLMDQSRVMTREELQRMRSVFDTLEGRLYLEEKFARAVSGADDEPFGGHDFEALFDRIEKRIDAKTRRPSRMRWARIAAAVVVPVLLAGAAWFYLDGRSGSRGGAEIARAAERVWLTMPDGSEIVLDPESGDSSVAVQDDVSMTHRGGGLVVERQGEAEAEQPSYVNLNIPRGNRFDIVLEDGTHVWLNAGSRLRFPSVFGGAERRVHLQGEGYFEVSHDEARPFVVEAGGQELRVLGTRFDVAAYGDEGVVRTTLVEGSVALAPQGGGPQVTLSPGEQATFDAAVEEFTTRRVDVSQVASWREGVFVFEGNTLEQVMRQLGRWYDMEYTFEDEGARGLVLRGMMPVQERISDIFDILETSGDVQFAVSDNKVRIRTKR